MQQLFAQRPQVEGMPLLRKVERLIERFVLILLEERIVAVEMLIHREEIEQLTRRERRAVNLRQDFGKTKRARRLRIPARRGRIEAAQQRERVQILAQDLHELRRPMAAMATRTLTGRVLALGTIFD